MDVTGERVVFVDPGLGGTGWAFFPKVAQGGKCVGPEDSGVLHAPKNERWQNQCHSLGSMLAGLMAGKAAKLAVLEMPELWSGSTVGAACATHRAKAGEPADLFKLTFLVGVLAAAAYGVGGTLPMLASPQEWKGQLSKDMVAKRVAALLRAEYRDHECDAVGMGLAAQGRL